MTTENEGIQESKLPLTVCSCALLVEQRSCATRARTERHACVKWTQVCAFNPRIV